MSEQFDVGRRHYYVDLKELQDGLKLVKISEISKSKKSSIIIDMRDAKMFHDQMLNFIEEEEKNSGW